MKEAVEELKKMKVSGLETYYGREVDDKSFHVIDFVNDEEFSKMWRKALNDYISQQVKECPENVCTELECFKNIPYKEIKIELLKHEWRTVLGTSKIPTNNTTPAENHENDNFKAENPLSHTNNISK